MEQFKDRACVSQLIDSNDRQITDTSLNGIPNSAGASRLPSVDSELTKPVPLANPVPPYALDVTFADEVKEDPSISEGENRDTKPDSQ